MAPGQKTFKYSWCFNVTVIGIYVCFFFFPAIGVWCHDSQRRSLRGHLHTVHEDHDHRQTAGECGALDNIPGCFHTGTETVWPPEIPADWKRLKKKNKSTPPTVSVIREVPPGGCVTSTCAWLWFSSTLRVGIGFKDEWESAFSISLQAAGKGSWSSPTWPWLVFLFVFLRVCLGSWLALKFHQVALIFFILFFF